MRTNCLRNLVSLFGFFVTAALSAAPFSQTFNGASLNPGWIFESPNAASSETLTGSALDIIASWQNGGSDLYSGTDFNAPRLLQPVDPSLDWTIETEVQFAPANNYQGAGLILVNTAGVISNASNFSRPEERSSTGGGSQSPYPGTTTYFRVQKQGINYTGWWSSNGVNWIQNSYVTQTNQWTFFGVDCLRQPWDTVQVDSSANFIYFNATTNPLQVNTFTWTGAVSSDWYNANNWAPAGVPGGPDTVILNGGNPNLSKPTNVATLLIYSGTLNAGPSLVVSNTFNWTGGSFNGLVTIAHGATLNVNSPSAPAVFANATLVNNGTVNWNDGTMQGGNTVVTNNGPWLVQSDDQMNNNQGGPFTFYNNSTFTKSPTTGTTYLYNITFNNSGTVNIASGTLNLNGGGTLGGTFNTGSNSVLNLSAGGLLNGSFSEQPTASVILTGGSFSYGSALAFSGGGSSAFTGGALTLTNNPIPGLPLNGGTVLLTPTFQGGSITNLTLNGSTLSGDYSLAGTLNWLAGGISGGLQITPTGVLHASGSSQISQSAAITNSGHILWDGSSNWKLQNTSGPLSGSIWNSSGGIFDILCSQSLQITYGSEFIVNNGLFRKMQDQGTTSVGPIFTNSGSIQLLAGTLNFNTGNFGGSITAANGTTMNFQNGGILSGAFSAGYDASINFTGGTFTPTSAVSFSGAGLAQQTGGTLAFLNNAIPNLQLNGGTLNLPPGFQGGSITNLTVNNQTLTGSNAVTGTLNINNSVLNGPLYVAVGATVNWSSGQVEAPMTIANGAIVNLLPPGGHYFGGPTTNSGTINWIGGEARLQANNGFFNLPSGVFNVLCDQSFDDTYGGEFFNNYGLLEKSGSIGNTSFSPSLNNFGIVSVQSGKITLQNNNENQLLGGTFFVTNGATMNFNGGGYLTGTYNAGAGGSFLLTGGAFTNTPTTLFTGAGSANMNGGALTLISNFIPNLQITGGTVNLSPAFQGGLITNLTLNASLAGSNYVNGVLNLIGGTTGPLTLASNSTLNLIGSINGPLTITPTATVNLTNGSILVPFLIPTNSVLNLISADLAGPVTNMGTANWLGGSMRLRYNDAFYNLAGAVFNIECDSGFNTYYGQETFNNYGQIIKSVTTGTTAFNPIINNYATVNVESGELQFNNSDQNQNLGGTFLAANGATVAFNGGGALTGTYNPSAGGSILLTGGTFTNTPTTLFTGAGTSAMNNGTLGLISNLLPTLQITGGTIVPSPVFQGGQITNLTLNASLAGSNYVHGVLNLTGSTTGPLTLASNATLNLINGQINGPLTITPTATVNLTNSAILVPFLNPSNSVMNLVTYDFAGPATNMGTINWFGGSGRIRYNDTFYNVPGGVFNIECDQTINTYYGSEIFNNSGLVRKFGTSGQTSISPIVQNTGTIEAGSGTINFGNATVPQNAGVLQLDISSGGNYGQISFNNNVTLAGTLTVTATNYVLGLSNQFNLIAYNSQSGAFAATNLPALGAGWQLTNGAKAISLLVTNLQAPTVALVTPVNNQVYILPSGVSFSASTSDSFASVTSVQYFAGTNFLGQATTSPYNFTWNSAAPGYYTVSALATDSHGGLATSAPVNISVFSSAHHATNYTWTGAVSTDWSTPGNWTPNNVPSALDTVFISSGTVNLATADAVSAVNLSGGTLQGPGLLTVTNSFNWTGGNINANLVIGTNATFNSSFSGALNGTTLNNYGVFSWLGGNPGGNAQIAITNYGLWLCQSDNSLNLGGGLFVNKGTIRKTANTGSTIFTGMNFTNIGTVDAELGTISFQSGGTLTGTYNAAANAAIAYNSGSFTLDQIPAFTGAGAFNFTGGTMTLLRTAPGILNLLNGNLVLGPSFQGGSITNLTLNGSTLTGTNSLTGTMNWADGTLSGQLTVALNAVLNITSGNSKSFNKAALINSGQVNWIQGTLNGDDSSVFTNNNLWLVTTDDQFSFNNGASLFVNNGIFRKTAFTGATAFRGLALTNNGTVDAESGTIQFFSGVTLSGTYNAAAGAGIDFAGGNFTLGALPNITGPGTVYLNGGNINILTNIPANLQWTGGTITLGASFQNSGVITNLTLSGSTLSGNYKVSGTLTSLGGSASGSLTILSNAVLNLVSGSHDFGNCSFTNFGSVIWTGGPVTGNGATTFVNNGLWLAESDDQINSSGVFINNSVYRKISAGESDINNVAFNNNGLVDVQAGLLTFQNGGLVAGTYSAAQFASINLANGAFTSGLNAIFTGAGSSALTGGTLTLTYDQITNLSLSAGKVSLASTFQNSGAITNLTLSGSTLLGSNLVTGQFNWQAGGLNNSQLYIASNAVVNILSTSDKNIPGSTVVNNGTVIWSAGRLRNGDNSSITNNGLWLVQCDYTLNTDYGGQASFYNSGSGVFEKTQTFGATTIGGLSVVNSGTITVQSGAINFNNSATYSQAGETLIFGVSAPNISGQLNLPGPVTFDGNLQVQFLNGYSPSLQDQLTPVTYTSESGAFASLSLPALPAGETWNLSYGVGSLLLNVLPPPSTNGSFLISGTVKDNQGHAITGVNVYATPQSGAFSNLIQNGSFEAPSIGSSAYIFYSSGATNITNWLVIGPTNDNIALTSYNWSGPAEDGFQFFDPTGNTGGAGIQQTFTTVPGASYSLIFYHGSQIQRGYNAVVGVTIGTNYFTFGETSGGGGNFDWRRVEFPFVANSNKTSLVFQELTGINGDDSLIDNVQVVPSDYYNSVLEATTDSSGHYQINAPNASYSVGVSGLPAAGFQNVATQSVVINNSAASANFVAQPLTGVQFYAITTSVNPATAGTATGGGSFLAGANVTLTATVTNPLPYTFVNWTENGIQQSTSPSYSFTVLRAENLVANFALPTESITTTVNPASAGTVQGGGSFPYHSTNTLSASANFGFQFTDWTDQNNNVLGSSASLKVVALSNGVYTANFTATNLNHFITTATLPANLTPVSGGGLYQNGQTAAISTAAFVTNGSVYYQFSQFLLSGNAFTNVNSFNWPITTSLQSNLPLTAVYGAHSVRPLVAAATANIPNPVKATTNFILTIQFDRSMQASTLPLVQLTNSNTLQPTVPANGTWSSTVFANDTYKTPGIAFAHGMDGTNVVLVSQAIDLRGDSVALTNVLAVDVDATPPVISNVSVTPGSISAIVSWNTDKPATSQVNFGPNASYGSSSGKNSQLLTSHSMTLNGLAATTTYHYQIISIDQAGNQTTQPDSTFATIAAPDLQVTGLAASAGMTSGSPATISWVDTNSGSGATFASWYDQIVVSNTTTHQVILNKNATFDPSVSGNIGAHTGQNRSYPWTLPNGSNGAGNLLITVTANTFSNQFELTTANNSDSISAASTLSAYPDLQIVKVSATPATFTSGTTVTLNWTDTNTGTGPVSGSFYDQITVTNLTTSTIIYNSQLPYNELGSGPIGPNQAVQRQASFTLPNGSAGVGSLAVGFLADGGGNIYEYNAAGTAKSNNTNALHLTSTLAPYPMLAVTNITGPASVASGGTMSATWVDINRGNAPATNAWTEQVFLSSDGTIANAQLIASFSYSGGLAAGQSVTNKQSFALPSFIAGNQFLVVKINALNEVYVLDNSQQEAVAKQPTTVVPNLGLSISPSTFANNVANPAATATITRYGSTASALLVSLLSDNTSAATVPASVTILAGKSSATFPVTAVNNNIAQGNLVADIIGSASGYANVTNSVTVNASAVPTLTINIGATAVGVSSNATVACSVSRNTATTSPLTVQISANPTQLSAPTTVTIPAGAASKAFNIQTIDRHIPLATYQATVTATATGFASQADSITIIDDDAPTLKLSFANTVVSKGAANPATQGALVVNPATTQSVTVLLSTPSSAVSIPASVIIPANLTNVSFPVNVVQDHLVTGDRTAVVTAQLSDANAPTPIPSTATTASITVTDNNGPSLSLNLANSTIAESGSTKATVTRNTQPTNALTVTLSSSLTTAATVPASITIPIGAASTNFTVSGFNPGVPTGPRVADITASTTGYGSGVAPLTVSDINIPDLVISSINVPGVGLATSNINLSYVISNQGLGATTNTWGDAVYYSTSSSGQNPVLVTEVFESSALSVGQSRTNNVTVRLPNTAGSYYFVVTANLHSTVVEANYQNNTLVTPAPTTNSPTYHAFVQADLTAAATPTPVPMSGHAYSALAPAQLVPNVPVTIGVVVKNTLRNFTVMTDANGNFTNTFYPIPGEAGHYTVAADYPGVANPAIQTSFDLFGLRITATQENDQVYPGSPATNSTSLINLSDLPITGITAQPVGFPSGANVQIILTNKLGADDNANLSVIVSAANLTSAVSAQAYIEVTCDQGAIAYLPYNINLAPQTATLVCNPVTLQSSMLIGQQKLIDFDVQNVGGADSGPITLQIPGSPWLAAASLTNIPSLAPGQSNRFIVALTPSLTLPLQVYQGSLFASAANTGLTIPFSFRAISDAVGNIQVAVQDEYTYFVSGAPLVTNAQVILTDPITGSVVASSITGPTGTVTFSNIDQGSYQMTVSAPQHSTYQSPVTIQPGATATATAFLSRQTVSYTWTVVPTTVQDNYQVTLQAQFETEVPIPEVVVSNPFQIPVIVQGQSAEMDYQISNEGLVAAQQISLNLPTDDPNYIFTPLSDYVDEIPAMSTITMPVLISWKTNASNPDFVKKSYARQKARAPRKNDNNPDCQNTDHIGVTWSYVCGPDRHYHETPSIVVPYGISQACADEVIACEGATTFNAISGVAPEVTACQIAQCIQNCATPNACLNAIVGAVCDGGDVQGALNSSDCYCPQPPPLPNFNPPQVNPPPVTSNDPPPPIPGSAQDPTPDPINWQMQGCTPGQSGGPAGGSGGSPQIMTVRKLDGSPTTAAGDVCAHVTIQLDQQIALTRNAFKGSLVITDSDTNKLSSVLVALAITDDNGNPANNLFGIQPPLLTGINAVDGTGVVNANSSGTVQYTFVPTHDAAPTLPVHYKVGGTLSYVQNGNLVTINLAPQDIYVYPDPVLNLDYFLQRDVIGDDPEEPGTVTPQPFNLGLMVRNVGYGSAIDFTVAAAQPQITENTKGLLIAFQLTGTQVGTNIITPSLNADLGTIAPNSTTVAIWQMVCSLAGRFTSYEASFKQLSQLGDAQTSLIDNVNIHQTIHTFLSVRPGDDLVPDFLVNDIPNSNNYPDTVYLSDGSTNSVRVIPGAATDGPITPSHMQATLTAGMTTGWNYLEAPDPGPGYVLYRATRSDGRDMKAPFNVWTTPLSFPASQTGALHTNLVHLVDFDGTGSYTLYYHNTNSVAPTVVSLQSITPYIQSGAVPSVQITFSEPIDLSTFSRSALNLSLNGGANLINSGVSITLLSNATYSITGLGSLTANQGNYQLTVNAASVQDFGGNAISGNAVVSTSWAEGNPPMVVQNLAPVTPNPRNTPVNSITVVLDKPVLASSFTYNAVSLTLNGGPNLINSGVPISSVNSTTFQINGLAALTGTAGTYVLTVNAAALQDSGGAAGTGTTSVSWTLITTGPAIVALPKPQSPRNTIVPTESVTFSEPINPATFTSANLLLTLNGGPNLINGGVTIAQVNPTNFTIQNLGPLEGSDGNYILAINGATISDLAGNLGVNSSNITWTLSTHGPAQPIKVALSPITGVYPNITASNLLTLTGKVLTNNVTVSVFDQTASQILGPVSLVGTNFSAQLNLSQGTHALQINAVDGAGNTSSNVMLTVIVDQTPIGATFDAIKPSPRTTPVTNLNVTFDKPMDITTIHATNVSLTFNTNTVSHPTFTMVSSNTYQIGGLAALTSAQGTYQLTVNFNGMRDDAGNAGSNSVSTTWQDVASLLPIISQVGAVSINPGHKLKVTLSATDPSSFPLKLQLAAGAPAGVDLQNTNLTWTPECDQGGSSNLLTVWAVETVSPYYSNSMSFAVIVGDCAQVQMGSDVVRAGTAGEVPLNLLATGNVTNLSFTLDFPTNRLLNWSIIPSNSAVGALAVHGLNSTQSVFTLNAASGHTLVGNSVIGSLAFQTTTGHSAFIPLTLAGFAATEVNNLSVPTTLDTGGRVVLVGNEPLLEAHSANQTRSITLYGIPGDSYQIQQSLNLAGSGGWSNYARVPVTNLSTLIASLPISSNNAFYRAFQFQAATPMLDLIGSSSGKKQIFMVGYGLTGTNYQLQSATNLLNPHWSPAATYTLSNSFQFITNTPGATPSTFYRLKAQ